MHLMRSVGKTSPPFLGNTSIRLIIRDSRPSRTQAIFYQFKIEPRRWIYHKEAKALKSHYCEHFFKKSTKLNLQSLFCSPHSDLLLKYLLDNSLLSPWIGPANFNWCEKALRRMEEDVYKWKYFDSPTNKKWTVSVEVYLLTLWQQPSCAGAYALVEEIECRTIGSAISDDLIHKEDLNEWQ